MKNEYCVYFHRNSITDEVFYIGQGKSNKRPYSKYGRSVKWVNYLIDNNCDFTVELFSDNLSRQESLVLEKELITSGSYPCIVNILQGNVTKTDILSIVDRFYYDESSPSCLRWKDNVYTGRYGKIIIAKKDSTAGCLDSQGYFVVTVNGIPYKAHRVVWVLKNDCNIPNDLVINHIDCNRSNNRICNLELTTVAENNRKRKYHITDDVCILNTSGENGIRFNSKKKYWSASWYENCVRKYRSFNSKKYGYNTALSLAKEWRDACLYFNTDYEQYLKCTNAFEEKYKNILYRGFIAGVVLRERRNIFEANYSLAGVVKTKSFSILKYGYDEAYRLACEWRKQMEEMYYK